MWIKYKLAADHALVTSAAWNHSSEESAHVHFEVLRLETRDNHLNKKTFAFLIKAYKEKDKSDTGKEAAFDFHFGISHG